MIGAVLAGGRSRRMGRPKELLPLADGRSMIDHVIDALSATCSEVVVLGETTARRELDHLPDLRTGAGPMAGLEALLHSGRAEQYIICPCDLPAITADLLRQLAAPVPEPMTIFHVNGEDTPRPLPARIDASLADTVTAAIDAGRRAVWRLVAEVPHGVVAIDARAGQRLANINTPEEYDAEKGSDPF